MPIGMKVMAILPIAAPSIGRTLAGELLIACMKANFGTATIDDKENDEKGDYIVDMDGLDGIDCPVYRIKKNTEGFDQQDLSTIETIIEPVKNIPV